MSTLVVYCYCETPESKQNASFFSNYANVVDDSITFLVIVNNAASSTMTWPSNFIIWNRAESEYDLLSYGKLMKKYDQSWFSQFDYYFFLNSSCRGPFLPVYETETWVALLKRVLQTSDLVGPVAEFPPNLIGAERYYMPFIHTYMFGTSKAGFQNLRDTLFQGESNPIILERLISRNMFAKGLKVKTLLSRMRNHDMNDQRCWPLLRPSNTATCVEIPGNYFGIDLNPYEIMFVKNIRAVNKFRDVDRSGISEQLFKEVSLYSTWA